MSTVYSNSQWDEKFHLVQRRANKNYSKDSVLLRGDLRHRVIGSKRFEGTYFIYKGQF